MQEIGSKRERNLNFLFNKKSTNLGNTFYSKKSLCMLAYTDSSTFELRCSSSGRAVYQHQRP